VLCTHAGLGARRCWNEKFRELHLQQGEARVASRAGTPYATGMGWQHERRRSTVRSVRWAQDAGKISSPLAHNQYKSHNTQRSIPYVPPIGIDLFRSIPYVPPIGIDLYTGYAPVGLISTTDLSGVESKTRGVQ